MPLGMRIFHVLPKGIYTSLYTILLMERKMVALPVEMIAELKSLRVHPRQPLYEVVECLLRK